MKDYENTTNTRKYSLHMLDTNERKGIYQILKKAAEYDIVQAQYDFANLCISDSAYLFEFLDKEDKGQQGCDKWKKKADANSKNKRVYTLNEHQTNWEIVQREINKFTLSPLNTANRE